MFYVKMKSDSAMAENKEGNICYQLKYNGEVIEHSTTYSIFPKELEQILGDGNADATSQRAHYINILKQAILHDKELIIAIMHNAASMQQPHTARHIIEEFLRQSNRDSLFLYMQRTTARYRSIGRMRSAEICATALNSFRRFRYGIDVPLTSLDSTMLEAYEYHLRRQQLSPNTISFYMKQLRVIYNRAVEEGLVTDSRPFSHVFTSIEKTTKRAIAIEAIRDIKKMELKQHPSRQFARDMFLFSFYTRGMSFVDIAHLRKSNLKDGILSYRRKKTGQQLVIRWEPCMQTILSRYAAHPSSPYLFSIIKDPCNNPRQQYQNAMFLINRHLKEIGRTLGLDIPLTMYVARHSWASIARDKGIPISVISEGMGHDSEKTTRIYLASLKTEVVDKANRRIINLL